MAEIIKMPKLGFDMKEGQLVSWRKTAGETVAAGEILCEIESDKATVEVESFVAGTLLELLAKEGDWIPIGAPIAIVGEAGESYDRAALGIEAAAPVPVDAPTPAAAAVAAEAPAPAAVIPEAEMADATGLPDGVRASPLARKVAQERGLDIRLVKGSGPLGRILKADVENYVAPASRVAPQAPRASVTVQAQDEVIPLSRIRSRIGARMTESKTTTPHFGVTSAIRMDKALALREQINGRFAKEDSITVNDLIIKAAALALRQFPNLNAAFNGDSIIRYGHVNIGIAVALEDGLINVVSKDADVTPLTQMGRAHREMVGRAREGRIKPDEVEGETFTISNLGPYDVELFTAIINPPSAAILAVGTAMKEAVVEGDQLVIGTVMRATLSADHRVTDGAEAAQFMKALKDLLEDPIRLLA